MASELNIYSIYKLQSEEKYYLLRTLQPGYSNASQSQEYLAESIEQNKRNSLLKYIGETYGHNEVPFDFIGEFQDFPIGDPLYADNGKVELNIYYMETEFGRPWIIIGNANSETEFLTELNEDGDLRRHKAVGLPKQIKAIFITEKDFDLSKVENYNTKNVRPDA